MAQYDFGTIDPNTKSGTALASDLNSWRSALHSTHSGATAPSYLVAGMLWADTTSANYELKMYDGAQWIVIAVIDATNNVARVAVDPAETSYITSTTSGQIRHLIASADIFTIRSTGVQFNIASPVIADSNNNELISFTTTASAVNQIGISNSATGTPPTISTVGGDTNIDLLLTAKGTGVVYTYSETAATNTVIDVARLESRSTGTPAAGIGAGLLFAVETSASNFEIGARIEAVTTDVTAGSEDFDLSFKVMAAGAAATEAMRIRSTGVVDVDALSIANTTVTSTAAELNILDGVTATTAELNILDGVTSTAAELNLLDGSVAGTVVNSKAVIYGAAGQVLAATATAGTNTTQVATTAFVQTALGGAIEADYQVFTAAGTWTKPSGLSANALVIVEMWGAGGGGSRDSGSCGGGGGGYATETFLASALGATEAVGVGLGGAGATVSGNDGVAGGNSTFGSYITAYGGGGGGDSGNPKNGGFGGGHNKVGATDAPNDVTNFGGGTPGGVDNSGGALPAAFGDMYGGGGGSGGGNATTVTLPTAYGGGGGGGASASSAAGGVSKYGGSGGTGNTTTGGAGTAPGGGGGAGTTTGGAGARGEVRVWTIG